ncbi:MAG TPA: hypothetical protein VF345_01295 [Chthoniobacterales bacterium]
MNPKPSALRPLLAGLVVTLAQIFVAVVVLAPEGPFSFRYDTLIQHDSYWFANIVDRGYDTTVPPISHKMLEVSNVAFFPAYPALAALLRYGLHLSTYNALLITAQTAAWGFWSYFFLFCDRWNISPLLQFFGALAVVTHPTAFFLVAGYSESLFMMALFGFIYWSSAEGRAAKFLAALHGFVMSATRIVGIPCAAFPVVRAVFQSGWRGLRDVRSWPRRFAPAIAVTLGATLGAMSFFFYCLVRWGRWDLYMLTQQAGWGVVPDYLAVFKGESYRWLVPALKDPTQASQMAMTLGALLFVAVVLCELLPVVRRSATWTTRIGFYFCGAIIYYISVSGVACVEMESMLRYEFCLHALIVLAFVHFLHQLRTPPPLVRAFGMAAVGLLSAAGLGLQSWYVWNFTRGNWVA